MKQVFDIPYLCDASDSHKLDLYLPDCDDFDTVIWFHGGVWNPAVEKMLT